MSGALHTPRGTQAAEGERLVPLKVHEGQAGGLRDRVCNPVGLKPTRNLEKQAHRECL